MLINNLSDYTSDDDSIVCATTIPAPQATKLIFLFSLPVSLYLVDTFIYAASATAAASVSIFFLSLYYTEVY